ncbi:MAG TPA: DUF554 domain-containing protein [candidate division WOR-3 bacterium]|uniref:DUF554 domain-containing protein n=1 Tax=candidate division WOR-3 bacterium TaxID=2052148 RepID=A0A7V0T5Z1_UNCW3|nr:DUF554 domain-containing protein [candidate division WOR-3 bacterium]
MVGTLVNVAAVIAGSLVGLLAGARLPARLTGIAFQGIGLFSLAIGVSMAIRTANWLVVVFAIVPGAIVGELLDIDRHLTRLGEFLKRRLRLGGARFSEGMVAAFLLFCMGSMTVLGAIEEGLGRAPNLLLAKSVLDGFASIALAATFGVGVAFSVLPLLVYQGGLTLAAGSLAGVLADSVVTEVSAVGGLLLVGLGINILGLGKLKVINMLPALLFAGALAWWLVR